MSYEPEKAREAARSDSGAVPPADERVTGSKHVAVFFDLAARDGRRAVEVRALESVANGYYASPRSTIYSCAYETQAERILALQRARLFCDVRGRTVLHFGRAEGRHAAWQ